MIKLIATDMDHTLLNNESELPKDFGLVLKAIKAQNIKLVIASGRTLVSIKDKVADYVDQLAFVSDNGAIVEYCGNIEYISKLSVQSVANILEVCRKCPEASIIASGVTKSYVEIYSDRHKALLSEYYGAFEIVDDIARINEDIVKITMLSEDSTVNNYNNYIKESLTLDYSAVLSGKMWIDIMNKDISKGSSLKHLLDMLNIAPSELMAFGDYHNDITMLKLAKHSYAVRNAHADVKEIASEIIGYNYENAVLQTILDMLE